MCGKEAPLFAALIEGSQLSVCANCGNFGKILKKPVAGSSRVSVKVPEVVEVVVSDFAQKIHNAREKLGLTQKEFALKLNEKESVVQKLEAGTFVPPIDMAKRLERLLKVKLVEVEQEEAVVSDKRGSGPLTIGDILSLKKK